MLLENRSYVYTFQSLLGNSKWSFANIMLIRKAPMYLASAMPLSTLRSANCQKAVALARKIATTPQPAQPKESKRTREVLSARIPHTKPAIACEALCKTSIALNHIEDSSFVEAPGGQGIHKQTSCLLCKKAVDCCRKHLRLVAVPCAICE